MEEKIDKLLAGFSDFKRSTAEGMNRLENHLGELDERFAGVEETTGDLVVRMDSLGEKMISLEERVGNLDGRLEGLGGRIDNLEEMISGLDEKIVSLENRVGDVEEKTAALLNMVEYRFDSVDKEIKELSKRIGTIRRMAGENMRDIEDLTEKIEAS